ncbi:hypothetical protein COSO111634_32460 [Corallococcus soli]
MYTQAQIVRVAASSDKCTCSNGMSVVIRAE